MDYVSEEDHPRVVIPELCRKFYNQGWMTGTGGALSLRVGDKIFITPSGIQKELVQGDDLYVQHRNGKDVARPPPEKQLRKSTCTPLINAVYRMHPDAAAVFHLHTKSAVMASIVSLGVEFKVTHLKMIQGIKKGNSEKHFDYHDTLVIPIIENKSTEDELVGALTAAMKDYPETSAVLIRRHGMYVWGPTWQKAKAMAECYEYLFDIALQMRLYGFKPEEVPIPPEGAYL